MSAPSNNGQTKSDADVPAEFNLDFPEDILAICERFRDEWHNGGFSQLFSNWYPADVKLIPEALRAIGAATAAIVVDSAIGEMGRPEQWREQGHQALISSSEPVGPRLWTLDGKFLEHIQNVEQLIVKYEAQLSEIEDDEEK